LWSLVSNVKEEDMNDRVVKTSSIVLVLVVVGIVGAALCIAPLGPRGTMQGEVVSKVYAMGKDGREPSEVSLYASNRGGALYIEIITHMSSGESNDFRTRIELVWANGETRVLWAEDNGGSGKVVRGQGWTMGDSGLPDLPEGEAIGATVSLYRREAVSEERVEATESFRFVDSVYVRN
jgi:hypothetical protein